MSSILLIGDICEDVFLHCEVPRLSPERPCPIVVPTHLLSNPGMAANVLANLKSLSTDSEIVTIFPEEPSIKTRYVDQLSNQHLLRVDQDFISPPARVEEVITTLSNGKFDACVLSCYGKGFLNTDNMREIINVCKDMSIPTWIDTKAILGEWSTNAMVVKINAKEYDTQLKAGVNNPWQKCENLIVTNGAKGMTLFNRDGQVVYKTTPEQIHIRDVVGAGDTTLAALVIGYLETNSLSKAMDFASKAASVAVSKRGVVAVKREEVV